MFEFMSAGLSITSNFPLKTYKKHSRVGGGSECNVRGEKVKNTNQRKRSNF